MKYRLILFVVSTLLTATFSGCTSLHDGKGWEHEGSPESHQNLTPYIFEHRH